MDVAEGSLRARIADAVCQALQPLPAVLAGWEGGSVAFGAADEYSDIDLNFLVDDTVPPAQLYLVVEAAIETVSRITASHFVPPGRYYKLRDGGDFFLVDLCLIRAAATDHSLDVARHGHVRPLFDKGTWLSSVSLDEEALAAKRRTRYQELRNWFVVSQSFVRKELLRGHDIEALAAFWGYTVKPLVELLRMRYCPLRWDFGLRYLDRDLPMPVYDELRALLFISDPADLASRLDAAIAWGKRLLDELEPM